MTNRFVPIKGYDLIYAINTQGVVKRLSRTVCDVNGKLACLEKRYITHTIDKRSGYPVVKLSKPDGSYGTQYLHRLLAETFIPNPENKEFVNHKDGDKRNYKLSNLEWVTKSENQVHAIATRLCRPPAQNRTPVVNICTGETYPTIKRAAELSGIPYNRCKQLLSGFGVNDTCLRKAA